jgi:2-C-methyl-D-erythritol 4-phosphate cytidylyltransferase
LSAAAIIVAAGQGKRMGPGADKLWQEVAGRPVIAHTWLRFVAARDVDEVVVVVRAGFEDAFTALAVDAGIRKPWRLVPGGAERQDSVWNGLSTLGPDVELVAIHDGARPCVSGQLIADTFAAARDVGAAVAAQRVTDTIKESSDATVITGHLDRTRLWAVQTPQTFRVEVIRRALAEVRRRGLQVTDDTAACELIGQPVRLVESREPNPKVTTPADLDLIELLLHRRVHPEAGPGGDVPPFAALPAPPPPPRLRRP